MKISDELDLPEWVTLNVSKYNSFVHLSALEWLEQLTARRWLEFWLNESPELVFKYKFLEELFNNPILDLSSEKNRIMLGSGRLDAIVNHIGAWESSKAAYDTSFRDVYLARRNIEPEKVEHSDGFFAQQHSGLDINEYKYVYDFWMDHSINRYYQQPSGKLLVTIDLEAPNNLIIEQFKSLLEEHRKVDKEASKKIKNQRKFQPEVFVRTGIVPFKDLTLWGLVNDYTFSEPVMAYATSTLYVQQVKPDLEFTDSVEHKARNPDNVQTTIDMAEEVFNDEFLSHLAKIAASEKKQTESKIQE